MELGKANNIVRIPATLKGSFFRYWLEFLHPFHKLTDREMDIATEFLRHRFELKKSIQDDALLDRVTMSEDVKKRIRAACKITTPHFQVVMGKLRKSKFIDNGRINPKFVPKGVADKDKGFQLLLYFDFEAGTNKQGSTKA